MTVDNVGTDRKRKSGPSLTSSGLGAELGGFAVDPRPVTPVTLASPRKRMAGLGGGNDAADGSSAVPLSADTSQQTFLTTPHAWGRQLRTPPNLLQGEVPGILTVGSPIYSQRHGTSAELLNVAGPAL